ncbi:NADH dehydrogenase subunit F [Comamonas sp. Z1]|uniref:NADH-ubiquinone oxidoreductase-F iron-sulfur binding region domain-containing protein n=2 Tax=Comamonadaceae TaxID=80864 RepID=UPI0009BF0FDB|nr:NADH-ubiquinone oxidoreductase-F iron-sulfur binding region domain-containing protein [Comamonas thiooxydans]TYK71020.1 NADH dehydrogenase subunit F [Comamonas sp. Z1]TYK73384.1 NADH dehydrogenase subunit F [Comamonas sp. Z3]
MLIVAETAVHAGAYPGLQPRLMVPQALASRMDLAAELECGTYQRKVPVENIIAELQASGLQGRGGAGFAAGVKWATLAQSKKEHKVVIANGEEGEPASGKDQWLLNHRPHLVLDGLLLAAQAVGATRTIVYLSHAATVQSMRAAIAELEASVHKPAIPVEVHVVPRSYVAGEESAVCRAINGGQAKPTAKPPRPFERGVDDAPTLVSNVETLAHAAWISRNGAQAFRAEGTEQSPGTILVTLTGACHRPGVYEVPLGLTLDTVFEAVGGGYSAQPKAFIVGGWFGGMLAAEHSKRNCCYAGLRQVGSGLGCAAITVLGQDANVMEVAGDIGMWYTRESAQQCGTCIRGTQAIAGALVRINLGAGEHQDRENLIRWGNTLPGRGACAFLDGAAALARTVVHEFDADLRQCLSKSASKSKQ